MIIQTKPKLLKTRKTQHKDKGSNEEKGFEWLFPGSTNNFNSDTISLLIMTYACDFFSGNVGRQVNNQPQTQKGKQNNKPAPL